jgi:NTP pyrophosphatase (non-canonical NTP hydrolase)
LLGLIRKIGIKKMENINTKLLLDEIHNFVKERDWDQFHSVKNLSMALSVESSELLEIFQWMSEQQSNQVGTNSESLGKVKDELADIFYYLLRISSKLNIDLEESLMQKMQKNAEKYPIEKSKGLAKKYTEI